MQPGANRHQHRLFDALAQSRRSADPKFRLIGVQCPAWMMRETRSLGKLRRSNTKKNMQPGANINTDYSLH
jgi:hypothetical protein